MEIWQGYNRYFANQYMERWGHWSAVSGTPGTEGAHGSAAYGAWWTREGRLKGYDGAPFQRDIDANGGLPAVPFQPYHVKPEIAPGQGLNHIPHDFPAPPGR